MIQRILEEEVETPHKTEIPKEEETHYLSQSILIMLAIVAVNAVALNFMKKARSKFPKIFRYLQESTITTFIGVLAGFCLHQLSQTHILTMIRDGYQNFFMIILLPPIIFESTINMHKKSFFRNIGSILMFAVIGTLLAACLTALGIYFISRVGFFPEFKFTFGESLAFGSLISSTDPVSVLAVFKETSADLTLQSLIFGESILNDAISIVLYNTVTASTQEGYIGGWFNPVFKFGLMLMGSICIGFVIGIICAMVIKTYFGGSDKNNSATTEVTLMVVIPWAAYLIGEGFNLSGVVTILFCGIAMTKYALPYLTPQGKQLTQSLYGAVSSMAENLAFIFIGIGFFSFDHHWERLKTMLLLLICFVITASRVIQITIISKITNLFRNKNKITPSHRMLMIYSGFRGAMAFALATNAVKAFPDNGVGSMMLTLTLVYASLTIFVQGSFLAPIMDHYNVKGKENDSLILDDDDDSLENNSWDRVKFSFHKLENLLVRLILKWRDEDGKPKHEIYTDEESGGSLVKVHPTSTFQVKVRENDFTPVRRICSDGEVSNFAIKTENESHTKVS